MEAEDVRGARPDLSVEDRADLADVNEGRLGLLSVRRDVERLLDVARGSHLKRARRGDAARADDHEAAPSRLGVLVRRDRDEPHLPERRRRLEGVSRHEEIALDDGELALVERAQRPPPDIRAPFVDVRVVRQRRLLHVPGGNSVEPLHEVPALEAVCGVREIRDDLDLQDPEPRVVEVDGLQAAEALSADDEAVGRPGLDPGGVDVARVRVGAGRGERERGGEREKRNAFHA